MKHHAYDTDLDKNPANHQPLRRSRSSTGGPVFPITRHRPRLLRRSYGDF
jgi:hypothetical protein